MIWHLYERPGPIGNQAAKPNKVDFFGVFRFKWHLPGRFARLLEASIKTGKDWVAFRLVVEVFMRFAALMIAGILAGSALAQVNVASSANGGTATQSSLWTAAATADKAIDGNKNGIWGSNGIFTLNHTNAEQGAWLRIMFNDTYSIDTLNIWNRVELSERLNPFSVRLYDGANLTWESTGLIFDDNIDDGLNFTKGMLLNPGGILADMVEIQLDGTNYLHLAEVEAFAPVPEPATMIGLAAGGLLLLRRRKAKAAG